MNIPWIQVYSNLLDHPKTYRLADELKLASPFVDPNAVAAAMLIGLWTWAIQNAYTGDLSKCGARAISAACRWKKSPKALLDALLSCGWIDEDMKLHDWDEYAVLFIDAEDSKREKTRERVNRYRNKKKALQDTVQIQATGQDNLERINKILAGISGGAEKAVKSAMTRAVSHLRTNTSEEIRQKFDISAANIRANENVKITYRYDQGVQAYVTFMGQKILLYRYGASSPKQPTVNGSKWVDAMINGFWRRVHPSLSAKGHQLKSSPSYLFDKAFTARMGSGHIGIFERTGGTTAGGSDEIRELMGSSVPQMLGNEEVSERLAQSAMEKFEERLDHEVLRMMNGWTG